MDYMQFNQNIKSKNFKHIYLFNVKENYIAKTMLHNLKDSLLNVLYEDFNYALFDEKKININKVIELGQTLPLLDNQRMIVIKSESIKNKDISKIFCEYIKNIPDSTVIVVWIEGNLDKRLSLYKTIKKYGDIVDFEKLKEYKLESWLRKRLKEKNIILTSKEINYFIEASGYLVDNSNVDLGYFVSEIDKLSSIYEGQIKLEDFKKVISVNIQDEIFKLTDALRDKNANYAFKLLHNLNYNNVNFMQILAIIVRNLENMYICKEYMKKGKKEEDIVRDYSMHPYAVKMANISAKKYSKKDIKRFLDMCLDLDYKIKIGQISNNDAGIYLIEKISNR